MIARLEQDKSRPGDGDDAEWMPQVSALRSLEQIHRDERDGPFAGEQDEDLTGAMSQTMSAVYA
jgi:hypothetical protein